MPATVLTLQAAAPAVLAAFLASTVEVVEAFTIVLAVAMLRGWRPALSGTAAALAVLGGLVLAIGPLLERVPLHAMQLTIGLLLLLFGAGWLRKASLRAAGIIPLHDEGAIFDRESASLAAETASARSRDWIAGLAAFKAVLLEGLEVIFIVIAVGAGHRGMLWPAAGGAALACALVLLFGALIHKPLTRVPENTLKFAVGVMLSAYGAFWTGEGLGLDWPGQDAALIVLAVIFLGTSLAAVQIVRKPQPREA